MFPIGKPEWVYESDPERQRKLMRADTIGILVAIVLFVVIIGGLFLIGALG